MPDLGQGDGPAGCIGDGVPVPEVEKGVIAARHTDVLAPETGAENHAVPGLVHVIGIRCPKPVKGDAGVDEEVFELHAVADFEYAGRVALSTLLGALS